MADTKNQLTEIEKGCGTIIRKIIFGNQKIWNCGEKDKFYNDVKIPLCQICLSKKQGFLLGAILQSEEEIKFLESEIKNEGNECAEIIDKRLLKLTADLKFYENKLQEKK